MKLFNGPSIIKTKTYKNLNLLWQTPVKKNRILRSLHTDETWVGTCPAANSLTTPLT